MIKKVIITYGYYRDELLVFFISFFYLYNDINK